MAVFTDVPDKVAQTLFKQLDLGNLTALKGIEGGIENTNYFASCDSGEYVLTVFERLTVEQLPFYLRLMKHLAGKGIPVPDPVANAKGSLIHSVCNKPAAIVNRLRGRSELAPSAAHCSALGVMLARMHLAARDFDMAQPNLRGLAWWNDTVPVVLPHLTPGQASLLRSELAFQNHVASGSDYAALPRGPVHADLFRDNVMFEGLEVTGVFDFYFAGVDTWLFDLATCLNDWCVDLATGRADTARVQALVAAYQSIRPLERAERQLLAPMTRAAALRFWVSRLWDFHLPREAHLLTPHDPSHFERILTERRDLPIMAQSLFN